MPFFYHFIFSLKNEGLYKVDVEDFFAYTMDNKKGETLIPTYVAILVLI